MSKTITLPDEKSADTLPFCLGDNICQNGEIIKPEHLTYCHDVGSQAAFVKAQAAN